MGHIEEIDLGKDKDILETALEEITWEVVLGSKILKNISRVNICEDENPNSVHVGLYMYLI